MHSCRLHDSLVVYVYRHMGTFFLETRELHTRACGAMVNEESAGMFERMVGMQRRGIVLLTAGSWACWGDRNMLACSFELS